MQPQERQKWAVELKDNELLPVLVDELNQGYYQAWTLTQDAAEREQIWLKYQALTDLHSEILAAVTNED